jgi:hypothetical protein
LRQWSRDTRGAHAAALYASAPAHTDPRAVAHANAYAGTAAQAHAAADAYTNADGCAGSLFPAHAHWGFSVSGAVYPLARLLDI